jgi:hypothetical protein
MQFHAFVFSWGGYGGRARRLQNLLSAHMRTEVISSEPARSNHPPDWHAIGTDAFFAEQWNAAQARFDGDVLLHVQADAEPEDLPRLLRRADRMFRERPVGILEPQIDYTDLEYDLSRLHAVEPDVYAVPITDCTCWFLHREVVQACPRIDPAVNRFGWGLCGVAAALSRRQGRFCLRDLACKVQHPRRRGYSNREALSQRDAYLGSLSVELRGEVEALYRQMRQCRPPQPSSAAPTP